MSPSIDPPLSPKATSICISQLHFKTALSSLCQFEYSCLFGTEGFSLLQANCNSSEATLQGKVSIQLIFSMPLLASNKEMAECFADLN